MKQQVIRITVIINKTLGQRMIDALLEIGITNLSVGVARSPVLEEKTGIMGVFKAGPVIVDDPVEHIQFLVTPELEDEILYFVNQVGKLYLPGRGTVISEELTLARGHEELGPNRITVPQAEQIHLQQDIVGITCIVQRGQGDVIARIGLDTGTCVPLVTYGYGTGIRDKMGLLRITIPAEKDIIQIFVSKFDVDIIFQMMIDAGKLYQPGKGFILQYPLRKGQINMKVALGKSRAAASIEQVVAVIDQMKGDASWRTHSGVDEDSKKQQIYLSGIDFSLTCNESVSAELVKVAMANGAAGATISKVNNVTSEKSEKTIPKAREICDMIVAEDQIDNLVAALEEAGAFSDEAHGQVVLREAPRAFTYIKK